MAAPAVVPRRSRSADCLSRAETAVSRHLGFVTPASPLAARFQASLALAALIGAAVAIAQGMIVMAVEPRPGIRLLRVAANALLAFNLVAVVVGPLRAGRIARGAAWWAFGSLGYMAIIAATIGFRHQPQVVALAMLPAMVLSVLGRWRTFLAWWLGMLAVLAVGLGNPVQDLTAANPWTQFTAITLMLLVTGIVLVRHRQNVTADMRESAARARALAEAVDSLRDANARLEALAAERDQLAREREAAQRLEATGRMAGAVAHDFNNILAALRGHVDLLEDGACTPADIAEMRRTIGRGAGLTGQLLAFARRQPSRPEPLDLATVARTLTPMLERLAGTHVRLVVDAPVVVGVHADRTQLEQVLVNLVVNAREALPTGGTVTIRVRPDDDDVTAALLDVEDDGVGMDAETRAHMFEPFFTTRADHGGTGLGLSTVYGIVHRHDGRIDVRSAPGTGTRVRIRFPRVADLPAAAVAEPATPATVVGERIALLVEDEPAVRQVLERILQKAGCTVIVVPDGTQALLELAPRPVRFDLVVTDVRMPGASGAEVAAAYLAARPDGKVVLVSGDLDPALVDGLRGKGDVTFLAKPFSRDALLAAIAPVRSRSSGDER